MDNMPLFPLDIVVVPKERIPLHIFEPRYKRMIKDSIKTGDSFGIVLKDGKGVKSIGCSVNIIRVLKEHTSGEYDITEGLMFSLPLSISENSYKVIPDVNINSKIADLIKLSEKELLKERDIVKQYLP